MYCQACGAKNSDEAKFCNQCGTRIAAAGEAGGPLAGDTARSPTGPGATSPGAGAPQASSAVPAHRPNAYHPDTGFGGPSMLSVSLASIGVKSTKKVWLGIALLAALLVGLGWLGAWLARGEPEVVVEAGHAEPDDPFVIGSPLPEGEVPAEVDIVSGSEGGPSGASPSMAAAPGASSSAGGSSATGGSTATPGPMGRATPRRGGEASSERTGRTTAAMSTGGSPTSMEEPSGRSGPTAMTSTETTSMNTEATSMSAATTGGGSTMAPTDAPEERDLELDLYSSRVRYVIRRYYASRAQACFDRATRNAPTVSGTVVVSMTIGADGSVQRARTTRNTTGDESLGQCLQAQVSTWRLPPPPGGSLDMQMPFSR